MILAVRLLVGFVPCAPPRVRHRHPFVRVSSLSRPCQVAASGACISDRRAFQHIRKSTNRCDGTHECRLGVVTLALGTDAEPAFLQRLEVSALNSTHVGSRRVVSQAWAVVLWRLTHATRGWGPSASQWAESTLGPALGSDAGDVGGEEVDSVSVEVAPGSVVVLGGSRVGVPSQDLGVA